MMESNNGLHMQVCCGHTSAMRLRGILVSALTGLALAGAEAKTVALWPIDWDYDNNEYDLRCATSPAYDLTPMKTLTPAGGADTLAWNLPPNPDASDFLFTPATFSSLMSTTGEGYLQANVGNRTLAKDKAYTVEGWVKFTGTGGTGGATWIVMVNTGVAHLRLVQKDGKYYFRVWAPNPTTGGSIDTEFAGPGLTAEELVDGKWHHWAYTQLPNDGNGKRIFEAFWDGVSVGTLEDGAVTGTGYTDSNGTFMLGTRGSSGNTIKGGMEYVRISDEVLGPSEFLCAGGAGTMVDTSGKSAVVYLTPNGSQNLQWISTGVSLKGDARKTCTAEIWVYPLQGTIMQHLIEQYAAGNGRQNFVIQSDGTLFMKLFGYDGDCEIQSTATVPLCTWSHVAWVADNDVWRLYLNGELVAEESGHDGQLLDASSADGFVIGNTRSSNPNGASSAYFAEARVWKCARTREEIRAAMNTRIANAWAVEDLIGYWPLNDGAAIYAENGNKVRNYAAASVAFTPSGISSWDSSYASGNRVKWISSQLPVTGTLAGEQFSLCNGNNPAGNKTNAVDTGISATPVKFTYMGWYRVLENGSSTRINYLFGKSTPGNGRALFREENGALTFWMGGGSDGKTNESLTVENCLPQGRWTHVALTKNASAVRFYVNGEMVGENTAFTLNLLDANLHIGGFDAGGSYGGFYGAFRNVGFWSKVLSADAIKKHMFALPDVTDPSLLGYWPLDEGTGNVVRNLKEGAAAAVPLDNGYFIWTKGANMPTVEGTVQSSGLIIMFI